MILFIIAMILSVVIIIYACTNAIRGENINKSILIALGACLLIVIASSFLE